MGIFQRAVGLFKKKPKGVTQVIHTIQKAIQLLNDDAKKDEKLIEKIHRNLLRLINFLAPGYETFIEHCGNQIYLEIYRTDLISVLLDNLSRIDYVNRKAFLDIVKIMLERRVEARFPAVDYICTKKSILETLVRGIDQEKTSFTCGEILTLCASHTSLTLIILDSDVFYNYFKYLEDGRFDICTLAFSSFRALLLRTKLPCEVLLKKDFEKFFEHYNKLVYSENYTTKCLSLKLLHDLLTVDSNRSAKLHYISRVEFLEPIMVMLTHKSKRIRFEAFNVFKIFFTLDNNSYDNLILTSVQNNRRKLIRCLTNFQNDRDEFDEDFASSKAVLLQTIKTLKKPALFPGNEEEFKRKLQDMVDNKLKDKAKTRVMNRYKFDAAGSYERKQNTR